MLIEAKTFTVAAATAGVWLCSEAFVPGAQVTREVQARSL